MNQPAYDVDMIMMYENGQLGEEETITFFQGMIDSGIVWKLQGHYGRTAKSLIEAGYCSQGRENVKISVP